MKTISARLLSTLSMITLLAGSTAALAAPVRPPEVATKKVRVADLDLSTAAGASTLYGRIKEAARVVCRHETSVKLELECRARAIEEAVGLVGSPLLVSIHHSATGRTQELVVR
jgi:UrcA family protein